ncbi:envelope glycoprotein [Simian immunodeficiency virus]|uniref:Envelope glycoprotein gp160 n=1 Tax=Simian immunodeficiency virus TaxID=11723 RepID=V5TAJ9_SIV|nr:envelope glycoprotein [Simian immunodeficiency virus]
MKLSVILVILGISIVISKKWVTVYQGVPAWEDAEITDQQFFCFSSSIEMQQVLGCLPPPPGDPVVQSMENISETFNAFKNPFSMEVWTVTQSVLEQRIRPCAKLSAYCSWMNCTKVQDNTTQATTTAVTSATSVAPEFDEKNWPKDEWYHCRMNSTAFLLKNRKELEFDYRIEDLTIDKNGNGSSIRATMKDCQNYSVSAICDESILEPTSIGFCAAPGYALLVCNDTQWNGTGRCNQVYATSCTHEFNLTISSHIVVNGSKTLVDYAKTREGIWANESGNIEYYWFPKDLYLGCKRRGNVTNRNLNTANGAVFYYELRGQDADWKARCQFVKIGMNKTTLAQEIKKNLTYWLKNITSYDNITIKPRNGNKTSDPEATYTFITFHGMFLYCNASSLWSGTTTVMNCTIRKLVNSWVTHAKILYGPPLKGTLQTYWEKQPVLAFMGSVEKGENKTGCAYPAAVNWKHAASTLELGNYKLVKITPTAFVPTDHRRGGTAVVREKRGIFAFSLIALLSGAGAAMGSASVALTIQAQSLLDGLVRQQRQLLKLVETQSALLQLTVWGVKNLQVRVATIERYLEEQAKLAVIGCANLQVCRTAVPWNSTWGDEQPWMNMTWKQWHERVKNYTDVIQEELQEAYELQEENEKKLAELGDWTSWFSGFGIFSWFKYIMYAGYAIVGLIGLRIGWLLISCFSSGFRRRKFQRLGREEELTTILQIPTQTQWEQPDNAEELDSDSGSSSSRFWLLVKEWWTHLSRICRNGIHTLQGEQPLPDGETHQPRRMPLQALWRLLVPRSANLAIPQTLQRWLRSATSAGRRALESCGRWIRGDPQGPA